ncbi:MAG: hypothetical protein RIC55_23275 [Pirellulaceae bacterium]
MKRLICILSIASLVLAARCHSATAAAPLEAFPDTVAVVIRFESVDRFVGSVHEMLGAISPGAAAAASEFEGEVIGEMLELDDRTEAIDRKAPAMLAVFPIEVGGPPSAVVVKTNDIAALRRAVLRVGEDVALREEALDNGFTRYEHNGQSLFVAKWNEYWIYTKRAEVADAMNLKSENRRTMADVLDMRARAVFDGGDAALAVNSAHLAVKFKTQIEGARQQIFTSIDALPEEQLGNNAEVARKIYKDMTGIAFDALFDSTWAVGHVKLTAEGGQVEALAGVRAETKTDRLLAENPTLPLETLGLLPAEAPIYMGLAVDYARFLDTWTRTAYLATAADKEEAEAAAKQMQQAKVRSSVVSYALPEKEGAGIAVCTLQEADDAGKVRGAFLRFLKAAGENKTPLFSMSFDVKEKVEQYKQHSIDIMAMKFKFLGEGEQAAFSAFYDSLFGGEALQTRLSTVGPLFVEATGNDPAQMHRLLDGVTDGEGVVALEETYGKTRDKLGDEANLMVLIDAPRTVTGFVRLLSRIEIVAVGLRAAPFNFALKPAPSYSGLSIGGEPQGLRAKVFVPVEQTRGMLQIFAPGL